MEETQKAEKEPNYIELSNDSQNTGNIFNELSGELGDLDFAEKAALKETQKQEPIEIVYMIMSKLFILGVIATIIVSIDVFARTSEDNSLFSNLPICSYLSFGVDAYDNTDCKTVTMIVADKTAEKEKIEKNIVTNLIILVPRFLQSLDMTSSPKVQFIQEHTGDSRVALLDTMDRFVELKNKTNYQGEDIECKSINTDEQGKFSVSCQVYGGALIAPRGIKTKTSREVALSFLGRLSDPKSGFQILSYPKVLDIAEYKTGTGLLFGKGLFTGQNPSNTNQWNLTL
ncbi:MAG: hypothetical protein PHH70_02985, partial [Candidatus Gracilibacteria bacterium]|nr:hypothetical protein [Candidatus Gracilibacteria bacterium]